MKRAQPKEQTSFTASRFCALVGADRHQLLKSLIEQRATPVSRDGRSESYSLRDLARAFAGGDERGERLRKNRAEAERIELQNSRTRGELVSVESVCRLGERVMIAIRSKILQFPITTAEQDALLTELMELGKLDWSRDC